MQFMESEKTIMKRKNIFPAVLLLCTALITGGCGAGTSEAASGSTVSAKSLSDSDSQEATSGLSASDEMFSERDLEQEADLTDATCITIESGKDEVIDSEGVYVIRGTAEDSTIIVDADSAKVQLVLDGVSITNEDSPAIYVKAADKVFITTTDSENTLSVTGTFTADGEVNTDAVIFSKDDVVLNGTGSLTITSTDGGISGKDDIKITGGTYNITSEEDAIEANDSIRISDGSFTIDAKKDALHSENSDDDSVGYIYVSGGTFNINASDDGIQATTTLTIDGGTFDITAAEGLEATYVQINDGKINISAGDDGINASTKSSKYDAMIEINGGELTINMGSGDTDALDANGSLYINGGTVDITAQFAFDFDKEAQLNGGIVTVNGEEITEITNSMTFGGQGGGFGGSGRPGKEGAPGEFEGSGRPDGEGAPGKFEGFGRPDGEGAPAGDPPANGDKVFSDNKENSESSGNNVNNDNNGN